MGENDIRGNGLALLQLLEGPVIADCPPEIRGDVTVAIRAGHNLLVQALVDLNRCADALEAIALNGQPRPL